MYVLGFILSSLLLCQIPEEGEETFEKSKKQHQKKDRKVGSAAPAGGHLSWSRRGGGNGSLLFQQDFRDREFGKGLIQSGAEHPPRSTRGAARDGVPTERLCHWHALCLDRDLPERHSKRMLEGRDSSHVPDATATEVLRRGAETAKLSAG